MAYLCFQATREGQASHAHVHEIIAGLRRRGWHVDLFEPAYVKRDHNPGYFGKLWAFIIVQLRLLLRLGRFDALYLRFHPAGLPTVIAARLLGIPIIQEINGPYEDLFISLPWTKRFAGVFIGAMDTVLRLASALVVVTPQLRDWAARKTRKTPIYVVPNGANTDLFRPGAVAAHPVHGPYVVFFGALSKWQGLETLLAAVQTAEWPRDVRLVIVGDGAEREKVAAAAAHDSTMLYLGNVPYRDVPGIVANSLAGLSPQNNIAGRSNTGLFPLKVFETLSCAVPVIVTDFPGQADLVRRHGCGLVVPVEDPEALARAVMHLYCRADVRREMGRRGREAVAREHSWDARAGSVDRALSGLLWEGKA